MFSFCVLCLPSCKGKIWESHIQGAAEDCRQKFCSRSLAKNDDRFSENLSREATTLQYGNVKIHILCEVDKIYICSIKTRTNLINKNKIDANNWERIIRTLAVRPGLISDVSVINEATRNISIPPLDGMLVHHRVTQSIEFAGTHLYTWVERGTLRIKGLAQEHNTGLRSRFEFPELDPGQFSLEASILTMKYSHLHIFII